MRTTGVSYFGSSLTQAGLKEVADTRMRPVSIPPLCTAKGPDEQARLDRPAPGCSSARCRDSLGYRQRHDAGHRRHPTHHIDGLVRATNMTLSSDDIAGLEALAGAANVNTRSWWEKEMQD